MIKHVIYFSLSNSIFLKFRSAPGIEATGRTAMRMIFHAIVPLEYWEWNYQNSSMHIRFSNEKLGNWRVDLGDFHIMK